MKSKSFDSVLDDIERLKGRVLKSIKPGAEITVTAVDRANQKVKIITRTKKKRTRTFNELRKIWSALQKRPAVHVNAVLRGSGSSRNQPETIFANLPYVKSL